MFRNVTDAVTRFQSALRPDEEVGLCFANFGGRAIHVVEIGFLGNWAIEFLGEDSQGDRVTILQHVSQLNLALKAVKVQEGHAPRRVKIGFSTESKAEP